MICGTLEGNFCGQSKLILLDPFTIVISDYCRNFPEMCRDRGWRCIDNAEMKDTHYNLFKVLGDAESCVPGRINPSPDS